MNQDKLDITEEPKTLSSATTVSRLVPLRQVATRKRFWLLVFLIGFLAWFVPWVPRLATGGTIEVTRLDAKGQPITVEVGPGTKNWVPIERVSKHLINAIVVAEDGKFYDHFGFDFEAMKHAYELNKKKGRFIRGGSTISQQVVKMAFLTREKTYTRKVREAVGTLFMELILPKSRILEWYVNLAEFGGGIYGVKQAGQYYFRTRPELLTTEQAIHLTLVIPSPNKWSKGLRNKSLTPFGQRRFARIAQLLRRSGYISESQLHAILATGNFGAPIGGYRVIDRDDDGDDCRPGDADCDGASPTITQSNSQPNSQPNSQSKQPANDPQKKNDESEIPAITPPEGPVE